MTIVAGIAYAAAEGIGIATETAVGIAAAAEGVTWLPVASLRCVSGDLFEVLDHHGESTEITKK